MPSSLYQRGTISVTNGSVDVVGEDTLWLATDIRQGDLLKVAGHTGLYFLEDRSSLINIKLDTPYLGTTGTGLDYTILRMSGDWGSIRVLGLEVSEYVRTFTANALTEEALDTALAQIESALAEITTTQFLETSGIPLGSTGNVGDWAIDPETGEVWRKTGVSTWTTKGNFKGTIGQDGATIHVVAGANPGSGLGNDGDIAINDSSSELFKKVAGSWISFGFFVGSVTAATAAKDAAVAAKNSAETAAANAATSATAASGSATAASGSATTATTKAGEASSSASGAAGSATTATTQAGIATTKAGEAATSATTATNAAAVAGGLRFTWSTNTAASDPTSGKAKTNNVTLGSATALYLSETDRNGAGIAAVLGTWDDSTSPIKAFLMLRKISAPQNFLFCSVSAALTDNGTWDTFGITVIASNGSFADGDDIGIEVQRTGNTGATGATGNTGPTGPAIGVNFTYSSNATDADPGNGVFRFDNVTISAVTAAYIDNLDAAGNSVTAWLDTFDDSTSTTKGYLMLRGITTQTAWAVFKVASSVVDGTGYRKLTLVYVASGGAFTAGQSFALAFYQTGDAGTGAVSSVNGQPGAVVLTTDDISDVGRTNKWATAAEKNKVGFLSVTGAVNLDTVSSNLAAAKAKTDLITVTSAVNLDTVASNLAAAKAKTDLVTVTGAVNLDTVASNASGAKAKTDLLTVSSATNLDAMRNRVNALDSAVILMGGWNASAGTFPGAGAAQAGESYIVTTAGSVGGVDFAVNDRLLAITDNASTTIFASNWLKLDYTDQVLSVAGKTGAVTLVKADVGLSNVDNTSDANKPVSTATQTALDLKADASAVTTALAGKANLAHTHANTEITGLGGLATSNYTVSTSDPSGTPADGTIWFKV